jgi:hypothetical protein
MATTKPASIAYRGREIELEPVAWIVGNCQTYDHLPVERGHLTPLHEITDWGKALDLAASIEDRGWQGAPLVVDGDQLLTGTHRYAACQVLGLLDDEIPTVEIAEVFAAAGLDLEAELAENGFADPWANLSDLLVVERERCGYGLPAAIREQYGIDWE